MKRMPKCPECGAGNPAGHFFCRKCGIPFSREDYTPELYALPGLKIMRIVNNMKWVPHKPVQWNETIDSYVREVEVIRALTRLPDMDLDKNSELFDNMESFFDVCHNPDFQIAFVGAIKTGKSTLINALLGRNYASTEVTPETAALTKFRSSAVDFVKILFYTREEWEKLWASRTKEASEFTREYEQLGADAIRAKWVGHKEIRTEIANEDIERELERWSSSRYAEHFFVKEIEVGISTLTGVPPQVVFVDTPGLLDPVAYRSEITREYIRKANAVFVCVDAQKIQKPEIDTISSVFSFSSDKKDKVYIIATHWDNLNDPETDWPKQKAFFVKQLTGPGFYDSEQEASRRIIHSAAYLYNIARDFPDISRDLKRKLQRFMFLFNDEVAGIGQKDAAFIMEKANIRAILKIIRDELIENYQTYQMIEIRNRYRDILITTERIIKESQAELRGLLESSHANIQELETMIKKKENARQTIQSVSGELMDRIDEMKEETENLITEVCYSIRQSLGEKEPERPKGKKRRK